MKNTTPLLKLHTIQTTIKSTANTCLTSHYENNHFISSLSNLKHPYDQHPVWVVQSLNWRQLPLIWHQLELQQLGLLCLQLVRLVFLGLLLMMLRSLSGDSWFEASARCMRLVNHPFYNPNRNRRNKTCCVVYWFVCLYVCRSVCLSVCLSVFLSVCL